MVQDTQLRLGIIGINGRGRLSQFWHRPDGRSIVAGAADKSRKNLEDFQGYCNKDAFITTDYHELLARKDIDAIAVTTPDFCHEEHAVAALEAGKPVYVDKPMAITIEGCDRMIRASRASGQKLMVGFNMRYMDYVLKMKAMIDQGMIGEPKAVWMRHFVGMGSLYYYHGWQSLKRNCTSLLLQKACHDIDFMHFLTGAYTRRVAAFGGLDFFGGDRPNDLRCKDCAEKDTCLDDQHLNMTPKKPDRQYCAFRKEVDIEDNTVTIMMLDNGIKATYMQCHFSPDYQRNYTFIGTEGRIENNQPQNKIWYWKRTREEHKEPDVTIDLNAKKEDLLSEVGHGGADEKICLDFVDMVLSGKQPPVPMEAGRMSVAAGCMCEKSLENGGMPYDIPPLP